MKKYITLIRQSVLFDQTLSILKQNKGVIFVVLLGIIFIDAFFIKIVSDVITFGILLLYGLYGRIFHTQSRLTFVICLGLISVLALSFIFSYASIPTEKLSVWLFLFLLVGIAQTWKE